MRLIFQCRQQNTRFYITVLVSHSNITTPPPPPARNLWNLCNLVKLTDQQLAEHRHHYMLLITLEDNYICKCKGLSLQNKTGYRQVLNTDMKLSMTQHFDQSMTRYLWFFSGQSLAESWALYFLC